MLEDTFCSSPWYHIRINPQGYFIPCRWMPEWRPEDQTSEYHIKDYSIMNYFNSEVMRDVRIKKLNGEPDPRCHQCYEEDSAGKLSSRVKSLLKSAVTLEDFTKTMAVSPHYDLFKYSLENQGQSDYRPVDLQIDLGNACNSACIMCSPTYSSQLAKQYPTLNSISQDLFPLYPDNKNWTDDDELLEKFINELVGIPNLKYVHFLGGETLYLKSFYKICNKLIEKNLAKDIIVGTTTNATIYSDELANIIKSFKEFHLGVSIETVTDLNDYVRYPSKISEVLSTLDKFIKLRKDTGLYLSLRITPNVLTMYHIDSLFEYMLEKGLTAESCNIITYPECLKIDLLPNDIREEIIKNIKNLINKHDLKKTKTIVNTRRADQINAVSINRVFEYLDILENLVEPHDLGKQRNDLVTFLKAFESMRGNNILNHLPRYEDFLRTHRY